MNHVNRSSSTTSSHPPCVLIANTLHQHHHIPNTFASAGILAQIFHWKCQYMSSSGMSSLRKHLILTRSPWALRLRQALEQYMLLVSFSHSSQYRSIPGRTGGTWQCVCGPCTASLAPRSKGGVQCSGCYYRGCILWLRTQRLWLDPKQVWLSSWNLIPESPWLLNYQGGQ